MARFDVYAHPDAEIRKKTPFLLDVQNSFIDGLETRVVVPLRATSFHRLTLQDLNPQFEVNGRDVIMDTAALAAMPMRELGRHVASLGHHRSDIVSALDSLFGAY